jgi:hypothetical protein
MANDDQTGGGKVFDLQKWKEAKAPKAVVTKKVIPLPWLRVVLKLNPFHAGQLKKVKKAEENKTNVEVFLKALDMLAQYHELLANKGQLLVVYEGSDEPPVDFDFE